MAKKKQIEELTGRGAINRSSSGRGNERMDKSIRDTFGVSKRKKVL